MKLSVGTSGYSYKQWKGGFYPDALPAAKMLAFYAERLPAVEINNTFYRLPRASVLETWAEQVPSDFQFVLKASRRITHQKRLKETEDETGYLLRTAQTLGPRLGAILFQLPPNLAVDRERLERFVGLLPEGTRAAFEFRHPSWGEDAKVREVLVERDCALVHTDSDAAAAAAPIETASFGYLRLRRSAYERADLAEWAGRVLARDWQQAYVFFKHEEHGPALAASLLELAERASQRKPARGVRPGPELEREVG